MKKHIKRVIAWLKTDEGIACAVLFAGTLCFLLTGLAADGHSGVLAAGLVGGIAGGTHVIDGPLTTSDAKEATPELLRSEIDQRIVKIRPMSTPIDQISRHGKSRHSGSMQVDYYSVDTKEVKAHVVEAIELQRGAGTNGTLCTLVSTDNDAIFEPSETVLVPEVFVSNGKGGTEPLVLYVVERGDGDEGVRMTAVNHKNSQGALALPAIPEGVLLVRMGRAAGELDVQTPQFQALPTKETNNCQIFKAQVEQSTLMKLANKEVGWTFSDQEEAAIIDMRQGMEKNFLFGHKARIYDPVKRSEVMFTGGIWGQAGNEWIYGVSQLSAENLVDLCRAAFTHNAGSARKVLIGGTDFITMLNKIETTKTLGAAEKKVVWGLDFTEIVSKFGTLYVICSEIFDQCGHSGDAIVIDPEYVTKYTHIPFRTEKLDLRSSGVRNTDAIVITEASCLVLRYPQAHMRIVHRPASLPSAD